MAQFSCVIFPRINFHELMMGNATSTSHRRALAIARILELTKSRPARNEQLAGLPSPPAPEDSQYAINDRLSEFLLSTAHHSMASGVESN